MNTEDIIKIGAYVGGAYLLPKALSFLSTEPRSDATTLNQVRKKIHKQKKSLIEYVGDTNWNHFTKITAENAWISTLVISYLVSQTKDPMNYEQKLAAAATWFSVSCLAYGAREGLIYLYPPREK